MRRAIVAAVLAAGGLLASADRADAQYRPIYTPGGYRGPVYTYGGTPYFQSYGYTSGYARPAGVYPNATPFGYNPLSGTGAIYPNTPPAYGYRQYGTGYGYGYGRRW